MNISEGAIGNLSGDVEGKLRNFETFETIVKRFCQTMASRTGLSAVSHPVELLKAHSSWIKVCDDWLTSGRMPTGTTELSHFKTFGILLYCLAESPFVTFHETDTPDPWKQFYGKLDFADDDQVRRFIDGQHYYAAWLICYGIVEAYEMNRTDRRTAFKTRITKDYELDVVSHLIGGAYSPDSLYILMKTLFFRE